GTTARFFDPSGGNYTSRYFLKETLSDNTTAGEFTFTDTSGRVLKFYDFGAVPPLARQGLFKSLTDANGNVTSVTSWSSDKPAEVQRSSTVGSTTITESFLYTYTSGKVSNATLRRQTNGGAWTTVRQTDYTYDANGNLT